MNYSSLKNIAFGILWIVFGLIMNSTKDDIVKLIADPFHLSNVEIRNVIVFAIALLISILMAVNKYFDIKKQEKKKQADLFPYFTYDTVKKSTQYFIHTRGQSYSPTHEDEPQQSTKFIVKEKLIPWFIKTAFNEKVESDKYYLVLADSGMGKTTFMINLCIRYISKWGSKYQIKLIPFGDDRILSHLKELGKNQEQAKNTILLLDAFDEYKGLLPPKEPDGLSDDKRFRKRLDEIVELTRDFREIVITSRTQYFPGQEDKPYELKIPRFDDKGFHTMAKIYLAPFEDREIRQYLNKKYGRLKFWNNKKKQAARSIVEASPKLMVRPMLLSYMDYLVDDSNEKFETTYQIYDALVNKWIEREAGKRKYESTAREKFKKDLYDFSMKTALVIYEKQKETGTLSIDKNTAIAICEQHDFELEGYEITGQSLLTRDITHNWKFAHKSILEFLLAKQCIENITFWAGFDYTGMDMVRAFVYESGPLAFVKGGSFKRGEEQEYKVTVSDFYIGKYTVTQELWEEVMGNNPSRFKGKNRPVEQVSWYDVQEFLQKLSAQSGMQFRLPTEAEWEYAARGGNQSKGYKYAGSNNINEVAWYDENSKKKTHPVGEKKPNELGIYDMSGNVWEWCQDWYAGDYYKEAPEHDPTGPDSGDFRVLRGGGYFGDAFSCRPAYRLNDSPDRRLSLIGFRVACSPPV